MAMKIALGSDDAGFALKERLKQILVRPGMEVEDMGTNSSENVDYPDYARKVAEAVRDGKADRGVLVCATGIGVCILLVRLELLWLEAELVADELELDDSLLVADELELLVELALWHDAELVALLDDSLLVADELELLELPS